MVIIVACVARAEQEGVKKLRPPCALHEGPSKGGEKEIAFFRHFYHIIISFSKLHGNYTETQRLRKYYVKKRCSTNQCF